MKHTWKKAAAFVLATALVAGATPANVGTGGLFGGTAITASAVEATDYTIDMRSQEYENAQEVQSVQDSAEIVTVTFDKGSGSITPKYYNTGNAVRIYVSNTMTVSADSVITSIEFTFGSGDGSNDISANTGTYSENDKKWTSGGSTKSVTFTVDGTTGHRRIQALKVTVENAAVPATDISTATVNLADDNSVASLTIGNNTITDLSGFDITYGTDGLHTATAVPTDAGTYYAYVTAKDTNTAYTGTAKSSGFEIVASPTISSASVTLADDLALNFYVDGIADDTAAAEYTVNFTGACVDSSSALSHNATEGKYYATTHVYAKDINQPITAQLYKGDEAVGAPIVTSISDYLTALKTPLAAKMAANPTNPDALNAAEKKLLAMVTAVQLFGDASAAYFNPTETINDASVDAEITAYMTLANISDAALTAMAAQYYAPTFGSDDAKLSLVLDSKTAARLFVKGDDTGTESTINATKADYPTYHEITGLLPQNLADEQTITVGGTDYKFSALSWCNRVLTNGSASQKNINMAKAIMAYYTAAKAYTTPAVTAATVTTAPTAKTGVKAGTNKAIVNAGTAEGGTMMYKVTTANTKPTSTDGFSATVPTAEGLTEACTRYVWYYVKADDSHTDSEISATGIEVTIDAATTLADAFTDGAVVTVKVNTATPQWFGATGTYTSGTYATTGIGKTLSPSSVSMTKDGSNLVVTVTNSYNTYTVTFNTTNNTYMEDATSSTFPWRMTELQSITIDGVDITSTLTKAIITVTWNSNDITGSSNSFTKDGVTITAGAIDFDANDFSGNGTFTTTLGNFTKIEVTTGDFDASGEGWSGTTWTGNASSVSFSGDIYGYTNFVFTIQSN